MEHEDLHVIHVLYKVVCFCVLNICLVTCDVFPIAVPCLLGTLYSLWRCAVLCFRTCKWRWSLSAVWPSWCWPRSASSGCSGKSDSLLLLHRLVHVLILCAVLSLILCAVLSAFWICSLRSRVLCSFSNWSFSNAYHFNRDLLDAL